MKSLWKRKKEKLKQRKAIVQERFRTSFHLSVDQPRCGGAGTSTTGNVCRKSFENPELLSEVLDINVELIKKFRTILVSINCQLPIDPNKFRCICLDTAKMYNTEYGWFKMPPVVHKVLAHGAQIIINSVLPAGILGEDAAESRNKLYKCDRLYHARKTSRTDNLTDIMNRALESSDVVILTINLKKRRDNRFRKTLPSDVLDLIVCPVIQSEELDISCDDDIETEIDQDLNTFYNCLEEFDWRFDDVNIE